MKRLMLTTGIMLLAISAHAQSLDKTEAGDKANRVQVDAVGKLSVTPDWATITIRIESRGEKLEIAQAYADSMMQVIYAVSDALGISRDDLATGNLRLDPYPKLRDRFSMAMEMVVTLRDLSRINEYLDRLLAGGIDQIQGIRYELADREARDRQVVAMAGEIARDRAEAIAAANGMTLGLLIEATEVTTPQIKVPRAAQMHGAITDHRAAARKKPSASRPAELIAIGKVDLIARVRAVYRVQE